MRLPTAAVRVVAEKVEEGETKGRWRLTMTSNDVPLAPVASDGWTIALNVSRSSDRRSDSWQLDLTVTTTEAPNGLMDVVIERSLRTTDPKDTRSESGTTSIRALQAPIDRTVTLLVDGETTVIEPASRPLVRLNLKASDGASLTREIILKLDR
jgi:hypothetical protein